MTTATAVNNAQRDAEISRQIFGHQLSEFVKTWKPEDPRSVFEFQLDLTRLMVEAMRHKSDCMSVGLATYADALWADVATRPIQVIMQEPKR